MVTQANDSPAPKIMEMHFFDFYSEYRHCTSRILRLAIKTLKLLVVLVRSGVERRNRPPAPLHRLDD